MSGASLARAAHFTPLRYPGGKAKLSLFVKRLVEMNGLLDGEYVEPYAGGAAIAVELLLQDYISKIHINDISRPIFAFWKSVLDHTDELSRLVKDTPLSIRSWDRQKKVFAARDNHDDVEVGFATFFLNRTNRSGILNGGMIGGREQNGVWKINARYNAQDLVMRIQAIARLRKQIHLSQTDALEFLRKKITKLPDNALIYLDPPYFEKGKALYYDFYQRSDHERVAQFVQGRVRRPRWIVSYDNVTAIRKLYVDCRSITYNIGYSARERRDGAEVMFFSNGLKIPPLMGSMSRVSKRSRSVA